MKHLYICAAAAALAIGGNAIAQASAAVAQQATQDAAHASHHEPAAPTAPPSEGEVRKVDNEQGKITLRHGPLVNLDMPAMTMVFTAADPKMLEGVKQGDKVRFTADRKDGKFIVTTIELAK